MRSTAMISIVDDDAMVREATESLIQSFGYRMHSFASAENFLRSGHVVETSCLITDLQMPGMRLDLLSQLRADGLSIPVILMTAYPDDRFKDRALQEGVVAFLKNEPDEFEAVADQFFSHPTRVPSESRWRSRTPAGPTCLRERASGTTVDAIAEHLLH